VQFCLRWVSFKLALGSQYYSGGDTYGHKLAATFRFGYRARSWRKARLEYGP